MYDVKVEIFAYSHTNICQQSWMHIAIDRWTARDGVGKSQVTPPAERLAESVGVSKTRL